MKKTFTFVLLTLQAIWVIGQNKPEDDKFKLGVNGRIYFDGGVFFKDTARLSRGISISDLRIGIKGSMGKWYGKIDIGYAKSSISFKDIFLQYNIDKSSYMRIGHFAEPFGIDRMETSYAVKFLTPNAASQAFAPGRSLGIEYIGWGDLTWYAAGVFGDANAHKAKKAGAEGYAGTLRLVINPVREAGKILHIGSAVSFRKADLTGLDNANRDRPRLITYSANAESVIEPRKFIRADINDVKYQNKEAVELIGALGRFHIQSEYFRTRVKREDSETNETYKARGFYVQGGYLLSGKAYEYAPEWARMKLPAAGSLELVIRYSWVNLNHTASNIMGGKQDDTTIGVNYYIKKNMALKLHYTNVGLDRNSSIGRQRFNSLQGRLAVMF